MVMLLEYTPCSTCEKAKAFLRKHDVSFTSRHIVNDTPTKEEITFLSADGMLIKRPLLITENAILIGFNETKWEAQLITF